MTVAFFMKNIYSEDMEIEGVCIREHTLVVRAVLAAHIELIANGYRPELSLVQKREFRFKNMKIKQLSFAKPYKIRLLESDDTRYVLSVSGTVLEVENGELEIEKY